MCYTVRAIWTLEEEERLPLQHTHDCWEFLQHPLKLLVFGSFVPLLFSCCLCDSIYHLEPLQCVMNFLNLKCENVLLNTGLLRGRCCGGRSRRTRQGEGAGETWRLCQHQFLLLLFLLPPSPAFPSHCPTWCLSPPLRVWSPAAWRQGPTGRRVVPIQGGGKGMFIASYSLLTWSWNVQKLRLLFHSFCDLLCSDISNNQEEERICRGNFRAWLMPFVSSAGQSMQCGRESRSTILQARLTGL